MYEKNFEMWVLMTLGPLWEPRIVGNPEIAVEHETRLKRSFQERFEIEKELVPIFYHDQNAIMFRWDWEKLKKKVDAFFLKVTDEEIFAYNSESEKKKREEVRSPNIPYPLIRPEKRRDWIYAIHLRGAFPNPVTKIGISKNLESRMKTYRMDYGDGVELLFAHHVLDAKKLESKIVEYFKSKKCTAGREWFVLSPEDLVFLKNWIEKELSIAAS